MTLADAQAKILSLGGRLSGSRAYGEPRPDSDWDYWMPERKVILLLKWIIASGERWDSPFLGSVTWRPDGIQVEVSYLFPRTKREAAKGNQW